jgi:hypothetical protein
MRNARLPETALESSDQHQGQATAAGLLERNLFLVLQKTDRHGTPFLQRIARRDENHGPPNGHDEQRSQGNHRTEGYKLHD